MLCWRIAILPTAIALVSGVAAQAQETVSIATADDSVVATIAKTQQNLFADSWDVQVGGESAVLSGFRVLTNNGKNELVRAQWKTTGLRTN